MPHEHDYDPTLQSPAERRNLLHEGFLRLRRLFLSPGGLVIAGFPHFPKPWRTYDEPYFDQALFAEATELIAEQVETSSTAANPTETITVTAGQTWIFQNIEIERDTGTWTTADLQYNDGTARTLWAQIGSTGHRTVDLLTRYPRGLAVRGGDKVACVFAGASATYTIRAWVIKVEADTTPFNHGGYFTTVTTAITTGVDTTKTADITVPSTEHWLVSHVGVESSVAGDNDIDLFMVDKTGTEARIWPVIQDVATNPLAIDLTARYRRAVPARPNGIFRIKITRRDRVGTTDKTGTLTVWFSRRTTT